MCVHRFMVRGFAPSGANLYLFIFINPYPSRGYTVHALYAFLKRYKTHTEGVCAILDDRRSPKTCYDVQALTLSVVQRALEEPCVDVP